MNNTVSHQASPIRKPSPSKKALAPPQAGSTTSPCSTNATNHQPSPLEKPSSSHKVLSSQAGGAYSCPLQLLRFHVVDSRVRPVACNLAIETVYTSIR